MFGFQTFTVQRMSEIQTSSVFVSDNYVASGFQTLIVPMVYKLDANKLGHFQKNYIKWSRLVLEFSFRSLGLGSRCPNTELVQ